MVFRSLYTFIASFALWGASALAALAADPFTVSAVPVDATGQTAIEAQTIAISDGQLRAGQALIERLTLGGSGSVTLDTPTIAKLIRALEISNEKRSGNRYLGDITVAFNPSAMQSFLRSRNLEMISTQARERLVLPVLSGAPLWSDNPWLSAWQSSGYSHALTPVRSLTSSQGNATGITAAQILSKDRGALARLGQNFGVNQILIAETDESGFNAKITDIALDTGQTRDLGNVSIDPKFLEQTNPLAQPLTGESHKHLAASIVNALEDDWKRSAVTVAQNAVTTTATILYGSHSEWQNLQTAINGSAQIQDARLDVLSKDGALMTLTYGGDINRLRNELSFKGVDVRTDPKLGLVLARAGRF